MSNSGNKGVFSNNIGSSVGAFTKRNSSDAGNAGSSGGSTTGRRRVRLPLTFLAPLSYPNFPITLSRFLPYPQQVLFPTRR